MFINTIKTLYDNAFTRVAINGVMSSPFQVTRGVRQGDPLSCLLFDMAIEPLACMLRAAPNLHGYQIQDILKLWCETSGAKFNLNKTEILPIGSKEHRAATIRNRRLNDDDDPWEDKIRIAEDGNPIRSLGAWIGNDLTTATPWEPIIDKITKCLARWNMGHPSQSPRNAQISRKRPQ